MTTPPTRPSPRILIVGGGLAGIACAAALQSANCHVTLIEARDSLGGRATSFTDPHTGERLDNCQHVLLGCCTNLLDLYRRLGVQDRVQWLPTVHFMDAAGNRYDFWGSDAWPAPLHLGASMATFGLLSLKERAQVAAAMIAMLRMGRAGRNALESVPFGQWLARYGNSAQLVRKFYTPVLLGALNEDSQISSAKYAIQVFQDAMLAHAHGYAIGLPTCPLADLYTRLRIADLRLNTRVDDILFTQRRATGVRLRSGETLHADAVVLATNHHAVQRWISPQLAAGDSRFTSLGQLQSVPILGVHLWFDRPIMHEPAIGLIDGPLQWLFRKDPSGAAIHGVISAARTWPAVPKDTALQQFTTQIQSLFPRARNARLLRGTIVIEKRATFAPLPGTDAHRPPQAPAGPNPLTHLFLAGDYTQTHWPATMEGATRSGYRAAEAVLNHLRTPTPILQPDLPPQWPAKILGLT